MSNTPRGHDKFTLWDSERENARHFDERSTAEEKRDDLSNMVDLELYPPGESPEALYHGDGDADHVEDSKSKPPDSDPEPRGATVEDGGAEPVDAEIIDHAPDAGDADDLPDRTLSDDPLDWVPGHFVDEIEGVPTINRKGYAVIAEHYEISVTADPVTRPSETDFEYAEFQATATTPDGTEYSGWGSAHVERGDDKTLLAELAETRAMKRATAWATGVGMTAVEELKGELE